ncbi:MAG: amidohydrolase family protein [Candidatus Promineifilaceae bacterium]|jgi:imidazolonepropionase-like amidohydrolase
MNFDGALLRFALFLVLIGAMFSCQRRPEPESPSATTPVSTLSTTTTQQVQTATHEPPAATVMPLPAGPTSVRSEMGDDIQSVSMVVTNGLIVDGTGGDPISDGFVAIQGNRIVAVGQAADFKIPDDAVVIDAAGGTILPGIINAHVHNSNAVGTRRVLFLLDGVTSVCDLGIPLFMMKGFEEEGFKAGPAARGFKAGSVITAPDGYPGYYMGRAMNYEIQGEDEAEMAVLDLHSRGVDYIKVVLEPGYYGENLPVINVEELRAVVSTAHANDLLVRAHVTKSDMLDIALEAGVDVIEHVPIGSETTEYLEAMIDEAGDIHLPLEVETKILRMIEQGITLVPTLEVYLADPYLLKAIQPETDVLNHAVFQAILGVVRFYHDSGGVIALGNDYGNPGVESGMPLREMDLLKSAGLSPIEVIEAATRNAAIVCGHGEELGTLEEGKLADLIVVDGNPLDDLNAMDSVSYIVKDGELVLLPEQVGK